MTKPRGLTTRLCSACGKMAAHKTLYVKTETGGRSKWLRVFWVCLNCKALNHVVISRYRLETKPPSSPTRLVENITSALESGPLGLDDLIQTLRIRNKDVGHTSNLDFRMAMQYLTTNGIVNENKDDLTERAISRISAKSRKSNHLRLCPDEANKGITVRSVVSLYTQYHQGEKVEQGSRPYQRWFAPAGHFCVQCGYNQIELPALYWREGQTTGL
jgi:hypothetical protein